MSGAARTATADLARCKPIDVDPAEFIQAVLERLDREAGLAPLVPYCRPKALRSIASKGTIQRLIADGTLRAVKLGGLLLIDRASVAEWLSRAVPVAQRRAPDRGAA